MTIKVRPVWWVGLALGIGLGVGALTSILQRDLNFPWLSLVNSASPWLTPMFLLGAICERLWQAVAAGITLGFAELVGYYGIASVSGFTPGHSILLFWAVCAVIGGPTFGWAGWSWRQLSGPLGLLGTTFLPAAYFSEAAVAYAWRLHYWSSAKLFALIGVVTILVVAAPHTQSYRRLGGALVISLLVGSVAELLLGLIYQQSV